MTGGRTIAAALLLGAALSGCGGSGGKAPPTASGTGRAPAKSTPALDSMVVLGHSGTTGYNSDPKRNRDDARDNSWATGTNPKVNSVYQRLLATHPALKGNATSLGVDGSTVDDLPNQVGSLLTFHPLPDLVIIQSIDNDIKCDGTDAANEKAFATTLDAALSDLYAHDKNVQVFFVDQWSSVRTYAETTKNDATAASKAVGTLGCDTLLRKGVLRPAGIAALQGLVDEYFAVITRVCATHPRCYTDRGHLQTMPLRLTDLTPDRDHLAVPGQAKMAAYAWDALPAEIKNRP